MKKKYAVETALWTVSTLVFVGFFERHRKNSKRKMYGRAELLAESLVLLIGELNKCAEINSNTSEIKEEIVRLEHILKYIERKMNAVNSNNLTPLTNSIKTNINELKRKLPQKLRAVSNFKI